MFLFQNLNIINYAKVKSPLSLKFKGDARKIQFSSIVKITIKKVYIIKIYGKIIMFIYYYCYVILLSIFCNIRIKFSVIFFDRLKVKTKDVFRIIFGNRPPMLTFGKTFVKLHSKTIVEKSKRGKLRLLCGNNLIYYSSSRLEYSN